MTNQPPEKSLSVPVIEADVFDDMNETNSLIAQRAYEIYQSRGAEHGSDQEDWFRADQEILPDLEIDFDLSDSTVQFAARAFGFEPTNLEVIVGHERAVICGIASSLNRTAGGSGNKRIMRIVELPFAVDPESSKATFQNGTLRVILPRRSADGPSQLSKAAGG
jgi:HSP20 family molecular chaperone IbpA